jgi:nucleotide-binding universal stress UspA family protein
MWWNIHLQRERNSSMSIKDVLLPLVGDPSPAMVAAIEKCLSIASGLGARVSALAVETDIPVRPQVMLSDDLDNAAAAASLRSVSDVKGLLQAFDAAATRLEVRNEQKVMRLALAEVAPGLAREARLKDLTLLPVRAHDARSEKLVERLIFYSGRPILLCPEEFTDRLTARFDRIVIAWDHSAPAARAVAEALPLLQAAASVHIITATDRKTPAELESGAALVGHLAEHGITAMFETVKIDGSSVGKVFEAYVNANAIELLVMGAYRHSRLNEYVWGGASSTIIARPPCWVMMSH